MRSLSNLTVLLVVFTLACNDQAKEPEIKPTMPPADFNVIVIRHPVVDFSLWKPLYFAHDSVRMSFGISHYQLARNVNDTNEVVIIDKMQDMARAREFSALPDLKPLMDQAGVTRPPIVDYIHVIRIDTTETEIKDRVLVKHKVRDFDAWLKFFDEKGMETRQSFGLIDRGLGRNIEDPDIVYILFAISDKEKANARLESEELRKLQVNAGVEGMPEIVWYKLEQ